MIQASVGQPKLRTDLVVSRQEAPEGSYFVIKDPTTGRFFRLKEAEYFIAQQLNGSTPLDLIPQKVEERFGSALFPTTLTQFIETLGRLGLLETGGARGGGIAGRGRVRGSALYLRFPALDPDRLFNGLAGKVRFFFTSHFVGLSAFVIVCAVGITIFNWGDISRDFRTLWRFDALLLAWLTILGVAALHECAHGLTCKHFGGEVREMGFMLIYFQPAFYCNVSDAWLFPEKYKRLWVTFAGAYFEIFLWALATLTWRMAEPGTWVSFEALVIMATSGIKSLFNLNPLIKLDGYYLLSDYLGIPNLRQKSIGHLRGVIKRLWGGSSVQLAEVRPRERRIYLLYGLLAGTYSYWLLSAIALMFGNYLIERYQGAGIVLFGGFLMALFGNPLRGFLSRAAGPFYGARNRLVSRPVGILGAGAAFVVLLFLVRMELKVSGEFTVLPSHNADVRAGVEGIIQEIHVDEGDRVNRGDVVARLVERDYRAELRKTEAEIDEKRAKLKMLRAGSRPEEIEVAKSVVAKSGEQLRHANSVLSMSKAAFERELISQKELEEAEAQVAVREKDLEETQNKLKVLLAGSRKEEIEATEAEVARLESHRSYAKENLGLVRIASPISGVVTTPSAKLKELAGQLVKKGDLIAEVYELKSAIAKIAISEREIADVNVGDTVAVKARAYPGETFYGKVISIATTASDGDSEKANPALASGRGDSAGKGMVLVTTRLDNISLRLKPEMTGKAKIFCGRRSLYDLATRRLARTFAVELWSWW